MNTQPQPQNNNQQQTNSQPIVYNQQMYQQGINSGNNENNVDQNNLPTNQNENIPINEK